MEVGDEQLFNEYGAHTTQSGEAVAVAQPLHADAYVLAVNNLDVS